MKKFEKEWREINNFLSLVSKHCDEDRLFSEEMDHIRELSRIDIQLELSTIISIYDVIGNLIHKDDFWDFIKNWVKNSENGADACRTFVQCILSHIDAHDACYLLENNRYMIEYLIWNYHNSYIFSDRINSSYAKVESFILFYKIKSFQICRGIMRDLHKNITSSNDIDYKNIGNIIENNLDLLYDVINDNFDENLVFFTQTVVDMFEY
jgi:hypothetical protein